MTGGKITCVVADDHAVLRAGLVALLELESDIEVIGQAGTGTETLALVQERTPDLAVVDLGLEGIDGLELCRQTTTPVIIYTGRAELETLDDALEAGARGYLLKSGPPGELVRAVRTVHSGLPFVDPALAGGLLKHRLDGGTASPLSKREAEVLQHLADGLTTEAVGERLFLSPTTVRSYAENAMRKLEARNRVQAVANAIRRGLVD